jgi:hypothetical protein
MAVACRIDATPLVADILHATLAADPDVRIAGPGETPDVTVSECDGLVRVVGPAGEVGTVDLATATPTDVLALVHSAPRTRPPAPRDPISRQ